jgi:hypothetical protein
MTVAASPVRVTSVTRFRVTQLGTHWRPCSVLQATPCGRVRAAAGCTTNAGVHDLVLPTLAHYQSAPVSPSVLLSLDSQHNLPQHSPESGVVSP